MQISTGGATHVGMVRTNNEDSYRIISPLNLYVLADGMGGEAHGEVASALAVETVGPRKIIPSNKVWAQH